MMITLKDLIHSGVKLTPMMNQYWEIKKEYPDTLLFFRMGDFYELFFEDAHEAAHYLNIALTHRGKLGDVPIPMAGIPYHAAATYLDRITSQGKKVAICEQVEDPQLAKGIVKRKVVQVVGPGIPFDLEKIQGAEKRYLAVAQCISPQKIYLVLLDYTDGDFVGYHLSSQEELEEKLQLFVPKEMITYKGQWKDLSNIENLLEKLKIVKNYLDKDYFSLKSGKIYMQKLIPSFERDQIIKLHPELLPPMSALAFYLCSTQSIEQFYHIRPFRMQSEKDSLRVAVHTLQGLEILPKNNQNYRDSLLGWMDRTKTAMGARAIRELFLNPLRDIKKIKKRHDVIISLLKNKDQLESLRQSLSEVRDLERILAKVSSQKVNAQDLLHLGRTIKLYQDIWKNYPQLLKSSLGSIGEQVDRVLLDLAHLIIKTVNDELGASLEKGNLIKKGASPQRDRLAQVSFHSEEALLQMEERYREKTKIGNLKVRFNNISGYYIEVSKSHLSKVPKNFERRQTLVNAERFVTKELEEFEKEALSAKSRLEKLEKALFDEVVLQVSSSSKELLRLASYLAQLDLMQSLAYTAYQENLVVPHLLENGRELSVEGGWHPLVKQQIGAQFVAHDLELNQNCFFGLITGPNMAGKTTVMREMAIIQFLAQIGSFVPAKKASLSLKDYLFSRLGAADDILKGQSTFMVEMSEMAEILRHATPHSLIVVDEVGRGTSTYDGLGIAWALVEYLVNEVKAITLFSTHYHELIEVVSSLQYAKNLCVETAITQGDVQFLYRLLEQGATQSYGLYVAKLAGLPREVLSRAQSLLSHLEEAHMGQEKRAPSKGNEKLRGQLELFQPEDWAMTEVRPIVEQSGNALSDPLREELQKIDVFNMTPLQAMEKLHQLKEKALLQ